MPQSIHILLKDARRCRLYIAIVVGMTAMLAWLTPNWVPFYGVRSFSAERTVDFLHILLPLAWWFTIVQLIHGESLVGERQFWLTRPYSWKSLLTAKILFCLVALMLPFLISDCIILSREGFSPAGAIPDLLWRQCVIAGVLMLPPFVLAALTRDMRQFVVAFLVIFIALIVPGTLMPGHPSVWAFNALDQTTHSAARAWIDEWGGVILYTASCFGFLLWLYARRQAFPIRAILVVLYAANLVSSAWPAKSIAPAAFKQTAAPNGPSPEIGVLFAPERGRLDPGLNANVSDKTQVDIPIRLAGRNRDLLECQLAAISLTPENGEAWSSAWTGFFSVTTRTRDDWIELYLERPLYQRLSRGTVKLDAVFGVIVYETQTSATLRVGDGLTKVPGFGDVGIQDNPGFPALWFRRPVWYPTQKLVFALRGSEDLRGQWLGPYPANGDVFNMSPVFSFAASFGDLRRPVQGALPKNAEVELAVERPIGLIRRDLQIPAIQLSDYVVVPKRY